MGDEGGDSEPHHPSKKSARIKAKGKHDVGRPEATTAPSLSYNEAYLKVINKHQEMFNEAFMFCVFDDDRAKNSLNGRDSVRMMVNCSYIQEFDGAADAKMFIEKLRKKIYGHSREGGYAEKDLSCGSLDQVTYRIKWQKLYHKDKYLVLWYTTELEQSLLYVPTVNVTELKNYDTQITPVAFPAGYHASDFGNDFYAVKKRFVDHVQLTQAAVSLRPPLDGAGEFGPDITQWPGSEIVSQRQADAASAMFPHRESFLDNNGHEVQVFDKNAQKTGPESDMGAIQDGMNNLKKAWKDAGGMAGVTKMAATALKAAGTKPNSKQLGPESEDENNYAREKRLKAYQLALEKSREYQGARGARGARGAQESQESQEDGDDLLDTLIEHGWERPPPHGYGSHPTDRPAAKMILRKNEDALKKVFTLKTGQSFDKDDPVSKLWIFDKAKEAAAIAASKAKGAAAAAASGAASLGKAAGKAASSVGSAAGRAVSNTGSAVGSLISAGPEPDDEQVIENLSDRHVKVASNYTLDNTMSNNGLAGLYDEIDNKRIKNAFRTISKSDAKWFAFCQNIVGKNAWSPSNEKCIDGLDGMRETIINADKY